MVTVADRAVPGSAHTRRRARLWSLGDIVARMAETSFAVWSIGGPPRATLASRGLRFTVSEFLLKFGERRGEAPPAPEIVRWWERIPSPPTARGHHRLLTARGDADGTGIRRDYVMAPTGFARLAPNVNRIRNGTRRRRRSGAQRQGSDHGAHRFGG